MMRRIATTGMLVLVTCLAVLMLSGKAWAESSRNFDGTNDLVSRTDAIYVPTTSLYTFTLWVKTSASAAQFAGGDADCGDNSDQWCTRMTSSGTVSTMWRADSATICQAISTTAVNTGKWFFVTSRRSGASACNTWINGVQDGTNTASGATSLDAGGALRMGDDGGGGGTGASAPVADWNGQIAYVQWHLGEVMTATEINETMWRPGLIMDSIDSFWPLWGASPEQDLSGNARTGTVTGSTTSAEGPPVMFGAGPL